MSLLRTLFGGGSPTYTRQTAFRIRGSVSVVSDNLDLAVSVENPSTDGLYGRFTINLWDLREGACIKTLSWYGRFPFIALSADAQRLAVGGDSDHQPTIYVWQVPDGKNIAAISSRGRVSSLALNPSGAFLAYGEEDTTAVWFLGPSGSSTSVVQHIGTIPDSTQHMVSSHTFSADAQYGQLLAIGSYSQPQLWQVVDGRIVHRHLFAEPSSSDKKCIAFSTDGELIAFAASNGVHLWRIRDEKKVLEIRQQASRVLFHPDGQTIVLDQAAYRIRDGKRLQVFESAPVAFSFDGSAFISCEEGQIVLWNKTS